MFRIRPSAAWAVESLGWFAFGGLLNVARTKPGAGKFDLLADVDYLSSLLGNHLAAPKA